MQCNIRKKETKIKFCESEYWGSPGIDFEPIVVNKHISDVDCSTVYISKHNKCYGSGAKYK